MIGLELQLAKAAMALFGLIAAVGAVVLFSAMPAGRRARELFAGRRRLLLVTGWLAVATSAVFWSLASGGEAAWVHWLISLTIAGPLVVLWRRRQAVRSTGASS